MFSIFCYEQLLLKFREELRGCLIAFCNLPNSLPAAEHIIGTWGQSAHAGLIEN